MLDSKLFNSYDTERLWLFQLVLVAHNTEQVWSSTWNHDRELPVIFCAWGYRNECIFRSQWQFDAEIPSVLIFHKRTNAVLSALTRMAPNFLASELFARLWGVLKWLVEALSIILLILRTFDKSLHQECLQFSIFENFLFTPVMQPFDVKINVLEALKPLMIHSFINSSVAISIWEHSMSLSRRFLHIKAEN